MSRPVRTSHFITLETPDAEGNPVEVRVHYELETWTERHEHGYEEHFSEIYPIWATVAGTEVPIPEGTIEQIERRIG